MKKLLLMMLFLLTAFPCATLSQGLIGAPDESQRPILNRLQLVRAKLFHEGLKDVKSRTVYGSIVWEIADKYESLNQWQDALSAYNTLKDLKLPHNAIKNCADCLMRASDDVLSIDERRLASKVSAIESVHKMRFDRSKRLAVPVWGAKEQRDYDVAAAKVMIPTGRAMTLKEMLKP